MLGSAARQAINCFDREAAHVRLLLDVEDANEGGSLQKSMITLVSHLRNINRTMNGETARLRVAHFDAKQYFKAGDEESLTQSQPRCCGMNFRRCRLERTSASHGHALERSLLGKMPASIATQRDRLEDQLIEAEALGARAPWSYSVDPPNSEIPQKSSKAESEDEMR